MEQAIDLDAPPMSLGVRSDGMVLEESSSRAALPLAGDAQGPHETPSPDIGGERPQTETLPPASAAIAARRRRYLVAALPHLEAGANQKLTAKAVGLSEGALSRLLGLASGLTPLDRCRAALSLPLSSLVSDVKVERPSDWDRLMANTEFLTELRSLYIATLRASSEAMTRSRHTGSMARALLHLAEHPSLPPWAAERLRAGAQPIALLRELRKITPELEQLIRGERAYRLHGPQAQRDHTIRFADGRIGRQLAGFRWVFDDMSVNQPFFAEFRERGHVIDTVLSRQGLYCIDEATRRWLGVELIARPRESYRAADVLRFIRRLMTIFGKPDCIVLEQGIWAARSIRGYRHLDADTVECDDQVVRPGMTDEERSILDAGLQALGISVDYVHYAHGKIIENAFSLLQVDIAMKTRDFHNIGAHAGEFERAEKRLRQVRSGSRTPEEVGFAPMDTLADRIEAAMAFGNRQPKDCLGGHTPDAQWEEDMRLRRLPQLAPFEHAHFLPDLRERRIEGGAIHFGRELTGWPLTFRHPDWFAQLGNGYKVGIKFDQADLGLGAVILNYERPDNPRNRWRFALGQFICRAEAELPAPVKTVDTLPEGHVVCDAEEYYGCALQDGRDAALRRQKERVRSAFRALPRPGQPGIRVATARDGAGVSAEVDGTHTFGSLDSRQAPRPLPGPSRSPASTHTVGRFTGRSDGISLLAAESSRMRDALSGRRAAISAMPEPDDADFVAVD